MSACFVSCFNRRRTAVILALFAGLAAVGLLDARPPNQKRDEDVLFQPVAGPIDKEGRQTIKIKMKVLKGWHAFANPVQNDEYEPNRTEVKISSLNKLEQVSIVYPPGKRYSQQKDVFQIYEGEVEIVAIIKRGAGEVGPLVVTVDYTVCDENVCKLRQTAKFDVK